MYDAIARPLYRFSDERKGALKEALRRLRESHSGAFEFYAPAQEVGLHETRYEYFIPRQWVSGGDHDELLVRFGYDIADEATAIVTIEFDEEFERNLAIAAELLAVDFPNPYAQYEVLPSQGGMYRTAQR